jgi:dGTPase
MPVFEPQPPIRAAYAVRLENARGRLYAEPEARGRSPWQRDRDRIIHSSAFRKLQYKTQVFVNHEGDFFRTRLTHSVEVAQIARSIARELGLEEDLAEALALAHDLGHPPFGHAGEEALNACMRGFGGYDHNAQALKIVTRLESRYAAFDGLNLAWETLEGLAKHNGPLFDPPAAIVAYDARHNLDLTSHASAEAQVAAMADDIAYHSHDIDDGLRADLFGPEDIAALPIVGEALADARTVCAGLPASRLRHETIRRVIDRLVGDLVAETRRLIGELDPADADAIRHAGHPVVAFTPAMAAANREIKSFLFARMYRHWRVNRMTSKARRLTSELFVLFHDDPSTLPEHWGVLAGRAGSAQAAEVVADYIAGMTDRFAVGEHRRLTDLSIPG